MLLPVTEVVFKDLYPRELAV